MLMIGMWAYRNLVWMVHAMMWCVRAILYCFFGGGGVLFTGLSVPCAVDWLVCRYPRSVADAVEGATGSNVLFVHFCIRDFSIVTPDAMLEVVREVSRLVMAGHVLVVHCLGGHGR